MAVTYPVLVPTDKASGSVVAHRDQTRQGHRDLIGEILGFTETPFQFNAEENQRDPYSLDPSASFGTAGVLEASAESA